MIRQWARASACVLGLATLGAQAAPVQWLMQGRVTEAGGPGNPGVNVGDLASFIMTFDPATPVSNPGICGDGGIGTICRHNGDPTLKFIDIRLGSFGPATPAYRDDDQSIVIVRNNAPDPAFGDTIDGYTWGRTIFEPGSTYTQSFSVIIRGPEDLNLVTDGRVLPSVPSPSLLTMRTSIFQFCGNSNPPDATCDDFAIFGTFTSIRPYSEVPAPGGVALVALGLALVVARRRRIFAR